MVETAGIGAVTQLKGDVKETFMQLDKSNDGMIDPDEIGEQTTSRFSAFYVVCLLCCSPPYSTNQLIN